MPSASTFLAFSAATLALLALPGPAVMYIVTQSATYGRRAGLVSVAGIHAGTTAHVLAAMLGLSAVLVASATAFAAVKFAGAAYLVWVGVRSLRRWRLGSAGHVWSSSHRRSLRRVFLDGAIVNVLNPKTAIFFLAFVPQFVDPASAHPNATLALLGGVFIILGVLSDGAYALAGGWIGARLVRSSSLHRRLDLFAGVTYVGLGAATAMTGGHSAKN